MTVYLVGAGPGDPGLITVRGLGLLRRAEVLVYDRLIGGELLDEAPAGCLLVDASKRPDQHTMTQDEIDACLVEHGLAGRFVVRLKGGDPFVFGRGGEEALALSAAGVPFEVVPGITSAIAAPAYAGHSGHASRCGCAARDRHRPRASGQGDLRDRLGRARALRRHARLPDGRRAARGHRRRARSPRARIRALLQP